MSLEPITKKDIEKLFNKILRVQINRQRMDCVRQLDIKNKKMNNTKRRKQCRI